MPVIETVSLACQEGGADKVYVPVLVRDGDLWSVTAQYGRRGAALQVTKKCAGVSKDVALETYAAVIAEKIKKGYRPTGAQAPAPQVQAIVSRAEGRDAGLPLQLLEELTHEGQVVSMIERFPDRYGFLEKIDGHRVMVGLDENGTVFGVNKLGQYRALPKTIADYVSKWIARGTIIDGELVGDKFFAFDLLRLDHNDYTKAGYAQRHHTLTEIVFVPGAIAVVPMVFSNSALTYLNCLRNNVKEGIVIRDLAAPYTDSRRGAWKFKFLKTCTVEVIGPPTGKSSVRVGTYGADGELIDRGSVTITGRLPAIGTFGEVRYSKAYRNGSLNQPYWQKARTDVTKADCADGAIVFTD